MFISKRVPLALVAIVLVTAPACKTPSDEGPPAPSSSSATPAAPEPKHAAPAAAPSSQAAAAPAPAEAPVKWPAAACDAKAVSALSHDLDIANGIGVDLSKPTADAIRETAATRVRGKAFSFTGCAFGMQGNDLVWFAPSGMTGRKAVDASVRCKMKGGTDGVTAFRNAAMTKGVDTMKLDVRGVVAVQDDFLKRLGLTQCEVDVR